MTRDSEMRMALYTDVDYIISSLTTGRISVALHNIYLSDLYHLTWDFDSVYVLDFLICVRVYACKQRL